MRYRVFLVALCVLAGGCATAYQPSGLTGGFDETRLNDRTVQVRFRGNGMTSVSRAQDFVLRRGAELTLESGRRWFSMSGQGVATSTGGGGGLVVSSPDGTAIVKFLDDKSEDANAYDAVLVVKETNERAGGRLSPKARETLRGIENEK